MPRCWASASPGIRKPPPTSTSSRSGSIAAPPSSPLGRWPATGEGRLAGMLLLRLLYYIAPFVISVLTLTLREVILGARSKRRQRLAAMAEGQTRVEPRREAVYVRERKEGGA